jgi:dTDP-4-dehydrorhamnose reductase
MASILITGASGLLGKYLMDNEEHKVTGTWFTNPVSGLLQLDICNLSQVRYVIDRVNPDIIIHCAAIGNVDYVENNYTEAYNVNVKGVEYVLNAAKGRKFVFISSNAVFDGNNPPYEEQSKCRPINRYGAMKQEAEYIVMDSSNWLIIRPFMLYGWPYPNARSNPLPMFFRRLVKDEPIKAVNDIFWQPTSVIDAARVIYQLLEYKNEVFNIAPDGTMTLYDFALAMARHLGLDEKLVEPVSNDHFGLSAHRPVNTSYDLTKLKALGIEMLKVEEGLKELL